MIRMHYRSWEELGIIAHCLLLQHFCIAALVSGVALEQSLPVIQEKYTSPEVRPYCLQSPQSSAQAKTLLHRNNAQDKYMFVACPVYALGCMLGRHKTYAHDAMQHRPWEPLQHLKRHSQGHECTNTGTETRIGTETATCKHRCIHTDAHSCTCVCTQFISRLYTLLPRSPTGEVPQERKRGVVQLVERILCTHEVKEHIGVKRFTKAARLLLGHDLGNQWLYITSAAIPVL